MRAFNEHSMRYRPAEGRCGEGVLSMTFATNVVTTYPQLGHNNNNIEYMYVSVKLENATTRSTGVTTTSKR